MYQTEVIINNREAALQLKGMLNIQNIQSIKELIMNTLPEVDYLFINHDEAEEFDLSYLQVLVSLHKTTECCDKRIGYSFPESFKTIISNSGYDSLKIFQKGN